MPFDQSFPPPEPDMTKASAQSIVWLLRHQELWPAGFHWNYETVPTCAIGLCEAKWGNVVIPLPRERITTKIFGSYRREICGSGEYPVRDILVTPEMVADRIESLHHRFP